MQNSGKVAPETYDFEKFIIYDICENTEPVRKEDLVPKRKETTADMLGIIYDRLLSRKDITILTPREDFKLPHQSVSYKCNKCGFVREGRQDTIDPGNPKRKYCELCEKIKRKGDNSQWIWTKTKTFIERRGGKIINLSKEGEFTTVKDGLLIECEAGHQWTTTHAHLHHNKWCRACKRKGEVFPDIKIRGPEEIKNPLRYFYLENIMFYNGMTIEFPLGLNRYYMVCDHCGTATVVTEEQTRIRNFLCPNRCQRNSKMSVRTYFLRLAAPEKTLDDLSLETFETAGTRYKAAKEREAQYKAQGLMTQKPKKPNTGRKK